jgi:Holliday junction DNA helicase RuvB
MEDFQLDIVLGKGSAARSIRLDLPRFTSSVPPLHRATTGPCATSSVWWPGSTTTRDDLESIVVRGFGILGVSVDPSGAAEIARRARGTPRIANRLRRVRDYAEVRATAPSTRSPRRRPGQFGVDDLGPDKIDRPSSGRSASASAGTGRPVDAGHHVSEPTETVEDVYEPFLIQQGP